VSTDTTGRRCAGNAGLLAENVQRSESVPEELPVDIARSSDFWELRLALNQPLHLANSNGFGER